ncbi:hypothetical protein AgCh_025061 [Apium graveolens]
MTYSTRSSIKQVEISDHGTLRMMNHNFNGFMKGSDQKFEKLQEQLGLIINKMDGIMNTQGVVEVYLVDESGSESGDEAELTLQSKGAAKMRHKSGSYKAQKKT